MANAKSSPRRPKKRQTSDSVPARGCETCAHCTYECEGDFLCSEGDMPVFVISDFMPTQDYFQCEGRNWQKQ